MTPFAPAVSQASLAKVKFHDMPMLKFKPYCLGKTSCSSRTMVSTPFTDRAPPPNKCAVHVTSMLLPSQPIGIFYYGGESFIKKFEQDRDGVRLVSINRAYSDINVTDLDSFRIFGKVVG